MRRLALICFGLAACGGSSSGDDDVNPSVPLSSDETATACVLFGSCLGDGINDCFTDAMPLWSNAEARCMLAAGADCTAIRTCFGFASVVADPACSATKTISCNGTQLVTCGDGVRSIVSCPDASFLLGVGTGATCVPTATGALCGDATCSAASNTCSGSVASSCFTDKGVQLSLDCAEFSQTCASGGCTAAGGGGACTAGTLPRCDGAAIVRCSGGIELRTDCTTVATDASCFAGGTAAELYCGFDSACFPTKGAETCSGNSVVFCNAGTNATVDCTALGFSSCIGGRCL